MSKLLMAMVAMLLAAVSGNAQERRMEFSAYAGGLFSAGFQSYERIPFLGVGQSGSFQPARQASSGIFGLRASYALLPKLSIEASMGYSPLGVDEEPFPISPLAGVAIDPSIQPYLDLLPLPIDQALPTPLFGLRIAGKDTISYSGNVLFHPASGDGWQPYLTGGLGVLQRRADYRFNADPIRALPTPLPGVNPAPGGNPGGRGPDTGTPSIICLACSIPLPEPGTTNFAVNFGAGVKRYLSDRWGVRVEFRNTISKYRADTVNNPEATFGVLFRP